MKQDNSPSWILVVVGILGALGLRSASGTTQPSATTQSRAAEAQQGSSATGEASEAKNFETALRESIDAIGGKGVQPDVLIVCVPDPVLTGLAWYFDQTVDAVTDAAAALDYSLARTWLPWKHAKAAEPSDTNPHKIEAEMKPQGNSGLRVTVHDPSPTAKPEDTPGFLLLRSQRSPTSQKLLAVLLVGESPVTGPHRTALTVSLDAAEGNLPKGRAVQRRPRILGPFFSGSARTLRELLEQRSQTHARAIIITGSATGEDVRSELEQVADFESTVIDDAEMRTFIHQRLAAEHSQGTRVRIALLTESGTPYGDQVAAAAWKGQHVSPSTNDSVRVRVSTYRFPFHIAQVRQKYDRDSHTDSSEGVAGLRSTLALRLTEDVDERDSVPSFAGSTVFESELALRDMLTDIARSGFDYLEIVATDPADQIFLAREARKYASNAQLIVYGSADRMYTHPDLMSELSGMLVGASYPIMSETQAWLGTSRERKEFPSDAAEGIFNAALGHLSQAYDPREKPYLRAVSNTRLVDWQELDGSKWGPRKWLLMVANGRFWPLASEQTSRDRGTYEAATLPAEQRVELRYDRIRPSAFADGLGMFAGFLMLAHIVMIGFSHWNPQRAFSMPVVAWFLVPDSETLRGTWAQYLTATFSSLGLFAWAQAAPSLWILDARDKAFRGFITCAPLLLGAVLLIIALRYAVTEGLKSCKRMWGSRERWPNIVAVFVFLGGVFVHVLIVRFAVNLWFISDPQERLTILLRLSNPIGMSPFAALACISTAFYFWGINGLRRVQRLDEFPEDALFPKTILMERLSSLSASLKGAWRARIWLTELALCVLMIVPAGHFVHRMHFTLEARGFDLLFWAMYLILAGSTICSVLHFTVLTHFLRSLLRELVALPMTSAYDRIATKVSSTFGLQLDARVPTPGELAISAHSLEALAALAGQVPQIAFSTQQAIERSSATVQSALSQSTLSRAWHRAAHAAFFSAAHVLLEALHVVWKSVAEVPDLDELTKSVSTKDLLPEGSMGRVPTLSITHAAAVRETYVWQRLAEDFVAMRVATFISHTTGQIRLLMNFSLGAGLLLVCAIVVYPFQPQRFLSVFTWCIALIAIVASLTTLLSLERDEILSRLGRTQPGGIDFSMRLVSQVLLYAALPLLLLLSRAVPSLGDHLFRLFGPLSGLLQ